MKKYIALLIFLFSILNSSSSIGIDMKGGAGGGAGGAPTDAHYLTNQAEAGLSAEVNLGALTTGLLKITVAGGVATPSTAAAGTDYQAPLTYPVTGVASPTAGQITKWGASGNAIVDGLKIGTFTDLKWCTYTTANGLQCTENAPSSGDVVGPAGGVADGDLVGFDGETGKIIKKITSITGITVGGFTASKALCSDGSGNAVACTNLTDVTPLTKANLVQTKCIVIKDPTAASDYPVEWFPYAITITEARYVAIGATNWVGQFQEGDTHGASGADTQETDSTVTPGTVVTVTSFSNASIDANDWVLIKTTSISSTPTSISACFSYTID